MTRAATWFVLVAGALLSSGPLWAQAAEKPDEVIVRGQRLADFRAVVEAARLRVYDVFNDLNSDDAFDVHCQVEDSTGTRMKQRTCRPQFKDDISNAAARAWVTSLKESCPGGMTQDCIFSGAANQAMSRAQAEESWEDGMQKKFAVEMARVVAEHPELQQAMLDYQAAERAYDEARGGGRGPACDRPEPPPRCSR